MKEKIKLFDSELKIMELLWENGEISAQEIYHILHIQIGWAKSTTYTVIKKCVDKGAIKRTDPGFICEALISKEEVQESETQALVEKLYGGSTDKLIASLLSQKNYSTEELNNLKKLIDEAK